MQGLRVVAVVDGDGPFPDSRAEVVSWLFAGVVGGVIVLMFWFASPALAFQVAAQGEQIVENSVFDREQVSYDNLTVLKMSDENARFMNRIYRMRSHEIAYCGLISGSEMDPWLADTVNASKGHVTFSVQNCPFEERVGVQAMIHTHPKHPRLSEHDEEELRKSGFFEISCVQAGPMTETVGEFTENFKCFKKPGPDSPADGKYFEEVKVQIVDAT